MIAKAMTSRRMRQSIALLKNGVVGKWSEAFRHVRQPHQRPLSGATKAKRITFQVRGHKL
jgi:hypothetical protein